MLSNLFRNPSNASDFFFIPENRITPKGRKCEDEDNSIRKGEHYCQLWLVEMCLAKNTNWFKRRYPLVSSVVSYDYAAGKKRVPCLVNPANPAVFQRPQDHLGNVIIRNHALTPLFPYKKGLIEVQVGLLSMEESDPINKFIQTMDRFCELLFVPEVSKMLKVIQAIYEGIEILIGVGEGKLELGFKDTWCSDGGNGHNDLRAGYFVAISSPKGRELNRNNFCIVDGQLRLKSSPSQNFAEHGKPLESYSYMLFQIKKQAKPDWESLPVIGDLFEIAQEAFIKNESKEVKSFLINEIKSSVLRNPDLFRNDCEQLLSNMLSQLKRLNLETPTPKMSLYSIMQQTPQKVDAELKRELNILEDFLG